MHVLHHEAKRLTMLILGVAFDASPPRRFCTVRVQMAIPQVVVPYTRWSRMRGVAVLLNNRIRVGPAGHNWWLLHIDQGLVEQIRAQRSRCGAVLYSARHPCKPRGVPREARCSCNFRCSFCCADYRHRTTPLSLRFLRRRVYVAAIMVVVRTTRASAGATAATLPDRHRARTAPSNCEEVRDNPTASTSAR